MFGKSFTSIGFHMGRSLLRQTSFTYTTALSHIQTQANYLRSVPLANTLFLQNLREMLLAKRQVVDLQVSDLTSMNQVISLILRGNQPRNIGTLTAKCRPDLNC